jgi:hypothetical protein
MRRILTSGLAALITLAFLTRAMAAPVLHLHDALDMATFAPVAESAAHAHEGCESEMTSADAASEAQQGGAHSHGSGSPAKSQAKVCDTNGACCGPLATSDPAGMPLVFAPKPISTVIPISGGVEPESPHRPPSPVLA